MGAGYACPHTHLFPNCVTSEFFIVGSEDPEIKMGRLSLPQEGMVSGELGAKPAIRPVFLILNHLVFSTAVS